MNTLLHLLATYGLAVVFLNVLAEQLGMPVPAYPVLVVMGAWSFDGRHDAGAVFAVAVAACLMADLLWYAGGRRFGGRVLRTVCKLSISPDSCVRQTEALFARWGVWSLLVAKFVPGFGTIAVALSGQMRVPIAVFLALDAVGASLFVGVALVLGRTFHAAVDEVLAKLESFGQYGLLVIGAALAAFIGVKWLQRYRMIRALRMTRITVPELQRLLSGNVPPAILDVRHASSRERDGSIPGARPWSWDTGIGGTEGIATELEVVVYCDCPNEYSAAKVAQMLRQAGFRKVRPLHGGIDAWMKAGLPIQRLGDAGVAA